MLRLIIRLPELDLPVNDDRSLSKGHRRSDNLNRLFFIAALVYEGNEGFCLIKERVIPNPYTGQGTG